MFQQVSMHLQNITSYKKLSNSSSLMFRLIDRELILRGFKTEILYSEKGYIEYSFWKDCASKELGGQVNFLYCDRATINDIRNCANATDLFYNQQCANDTEAARAGVLLGCYYLHSTTKALTQRKT